MGEVIAFQSTPFHRPVTRCNNGAPRLPSKIGKRKGRSFKRPLVTMEHYSKDLNKVCLTSFTNSANDRSNTGINSFPSSFSTLSTRRLLCSEPKTVASLLVKIALTILAVAFKIANSFSSKFLHPLPLTHFAKRKGFPASPWMFLSI